MSWLHHTSWAKCCGSMEIQHHRRYSLPLFRFQNYNYFGVTWRHKLRPLASLFKSVFITKTNHQSLLRGLREEKPLPTGDFPCKRTLMRKVFPCHDVSWSPKIWYSYEILTAIVILKHEFHTLFSPTLVFDIFPFRCTRKYKQYFSIVLTLCVENFLMGFIRHAFLLTYTMRKPCGKWVLYSWHLFIYNT